MYDLIPVDLEIPLHQLLHYFSRLLFGADPIVDDAYEVTRLTEFSDNVDVISSGIYFLELQNVGGASERPQTTDF